MPFVSQSGLFDPNPPSPWTRAAASIGLMGGAYAVHKSYLASNPEYGAKLFNLFSTLENRSPNYILRTFALSDFYSSYTLPETPFHVPYSSFSERGGLNAFGHHMQRLLGDKVNLRKTTEGLTFARINGSPYSQLLTPLGGVEKDIQVRFTAGTGRLAASSSRYGRRLTASRIEWAAGGETGLDRLLANFRAIQKSQRPTSYGHIGFSLEKEGPIFQPYLAKIRGSGMKGLQERWGRIGLDLGERVQKMLAEIGVGLPKGSYNQLFHLPLVGAEGKVGLINELLTKRALPIWLAAGVALPYLDYLTGHTVSGAALDAYQKASIFHSELTDRIPGVRDVTDTYARIMPGSQYGPLALPALGLTAGALYHYAGVLGGMEEKARATSWRIFAKEGDELFLKYFNKKSPLAWGLAAGIAAMIPFIPGMLGSRQTAEEKRRIFSGEELVPVRSGRWWDLGQSPFEGGRIKEWRPHRSVLWRSHAEEASLYGSEEEYWAHNPWLHPFRYLRDPYYLEERNYEDRPYPITSPAFSNVPLIGPLLAATIGRAVKPERLMHVEDWDQRDYTLYSPRIEPRGPRTESKLEKMVLQKLSQRGYSAQTQFSTDGYRLDFVVTGPDGRRAAIESDGYTYHHTPWQLQHDRKREDELRKRGWDILHIQSGPFFSDPDEAMDQVFSQLAQLGIDPNPLNIDKDPRSGLRGLPPPAPESEFSLKHTLSSEARIASEFIGLPGFIARSLYNDVVPQSPGETVYLQGSRQMTSLSRRYYEMELGAGSGPHLTDEGLGLFGYSEPLRRFIQPEDKDPRANEIPNTMPSWMPGDDYFINFRVGDPYTKVSTGYARLPGAGYEALHPELAGVNPEDYPDLTKLSILADVAPYSREFASFRSRVAREAAKDTQTAIEYQRIIDRVRQTKESVIRSDIRRFSGDVEEVDGTIAESRPAGFTLEEYPGRVFSLSSVGSGAADLSAAILGEHNNFTQSQVATEVEARTKRLMEFYQNNLSSGTRVQLTVPANSLEHSQNIQAVVRLGGDIVNQELLDQGLGVYKRDLGGPEVQAMYGGFERALGRYAEDVSFTGDEAWWNPLRYIPSPGHTKLWQERTAYSQYLTQEVLGSRMKRWDRPIRDFVAPYARGAVHRLTGTVMPSETVKVNRELNTMVDTLNYLRDLRLAAQHPELRDKYTSQAKGTATGVDLFSNASLVGSTLPDRESSYFQRFLKVMDPEERERILEAVPAETARALAAQWVLADANIARAEGKNVPSIGEGGRLYTEAGLEEYSKAETRLDYGDYTRSRDIAEFFAHSKLRLPGSDSSVWDEVIDYQDVKLKIIQQEGYDSHDFNLFDDRANLLWRKPYVDGAVRELTSGGTRSVEQIRRVVEQIMLDAKNPNAKVAVVGQPSRLDRANITVTADLDQQDLVLQDMRRHEEDYS